MIKSNRARKWHHGLITGFSWCAVSGRHPMFAPSSRGIRNMTEPLCWEQHSQTHWHRVYLQLWHPTRMSSVLTFAPLEHQKLKSHMKFRSENLVSSIPMFLYMCRSVFLYYIHTLRTDIKPVFVSLILQGNIWWSI